MLHDIAAKMPFPMRETRFFRPPETTYAVWQDNKAYSGDDCHIRLCTHSITIYLVEYSPDEAAVNALRDELISRNIEFDESERTWLESEKLYQTTFDFDYFEKIRK